MNACLRVLGLITGISVWVGTAVIPGIVVAGPCDAPDNVEYASGVAHCLAIKTYRPATLPAKSLVVVLHGDLSGGGPADYIFKVAQVAAEFGAVGVAMMRPGYTGDDRKSSGTASRDQDRDDIYRAVETDSMAAAVAVLKKHHGADRVVMVGHSGGAAIAGVMLGRSAPLVDAVLLVSCPCDVPRWRDARDRKPLRNAESPVDYLKSVPKTAHIFALTGQRDRNTFPWLGRDYVANAKSLGLNATYIEVPDASHGFGGLSRQPYVFNALKQAIGTAK
jgi:predicted esterase